MKETNMEHFRGEIEEILESSDDLPCLIDGKLQMCKGDMDCCKCEFKSSADCRLSFVKWLMSEYKPEPVLTAREKPFVECIEDGWLTKSKSNIITWWEKKPSRDGKHGWIVTDTSGFVYLQEIHPCAFGDMFPFITWEDEEPWAVADLRKLKVGDQDED